MNVPKKNDARGVVRRLLTENLPLKVLAEFETRLLGYVRDQFPEFLDELDAKSDFSDENEKKLKEVVANFKKDFQAGTPATTKPEMANAT